MDRVPRSALRLTTLGRLTLLDGDGGRRTSVLTHSKQTALLLYLAAQERDRAYRRDILFGLLWPELSQERARVALNKAVFHLRRELGDATVVREDDGALRLGPDLLACDAADFAEACHRGDLTRALELYEGDFVPGFYVADAAEFMQWLDERRTQLRRMACDVSLALATRSCADDPVVALRYARRGRSIDPLDERLVRAALTALDACGERASALKEYQEFEEHLHRELDATPAPETRATIERIRGRSVPVAAMVVQATAWAATNAGASTIPTTRRRTVIRRMGIVASIAATFALITSYAVARVTPAPPAMAFSRTTVAVLPFRLRGSPEQAYLADGVSTLLAEQLDGMGAIRTVSPRLVLGALDGTPADKQADEVGRRFGAGLVVSGDVVQQGDRVLVSADLVDQMTGQTVAHTSTEGAISQVFDVVAQVGSRLATAAGVAEVNPSAANATQSPAALKAYLDGQRAFRQGSFDAAMQGFQRATEADTTFALAYWRLSTAALWAGVIPMVHPALDHARRHATRLPSPARKHLVALDRYLAGDYVSALALYRDIVRRNATDADAWSYVAEVQFHYGATLGVGMDESAVAWRQVLALEPGNAAALLHLLVLHARAADRPAFERVAAQLQSQNLDGARRVEVRALRAFTFGDSAARLSVRRELPLLSDEILSAVYQEAAPMSSDLAQLDAVFTHEAVRRPNQWIGWQLRNTIGVAAGRGEITLMRSRVDSLYAVDSSLALLEESAMATLPALPRDDARAMSLIDRLARPVRVDARVAALRAYFGGLLALRSDDSLRVRAFAVVLQRLSAASTGRDSGVSAALERSLRAEILARAGRPREALSTLGDPGPSPPFANDFPDARVRLLRAECYESLGDTERAHRWYGTFPRVGVSDLPHLAWALYRDALLYERDGDRTRARARFARALRILGAADDGVALRREIERRLAL
ncbi:MAG TPA: BTAD domain-containing putative transcriptional regulator [Gemmatimonadaceae bacterium]|nr:BTAD domain-containing putative transcriptional regulator [Gemmatimonadaceae bacterium]